MPRPLFLAPTLLLTMLFAGGCFGDSGEAPTPTATTTSGTTATSTDTPTAAEPTPEPTPTPAPIEVTGLFDEPGARVTPTSSVTLPARPAPSFPEAPSDHTILYNLDEMRAADLGPGTIGQFTPNGEYMAWVADGMVHVVDLATLAKRTLGPGQWVQGLSNTTLITGNGNVAYDLQTGASSTVEKSPLINLPNIRGDLVLRLVEGTGGPTGDTYEYVLERLGPGDETTPVLRLRAHIVRFAGESELIAATAIQSEVENPQNFPFHPGTRNIFTVDIATGEATFIATVSVLGGIPFSASDRYITWTEDYCSNDDVTILVDRQTGEATRIIGGSWIEVTPTNLLGDGWGFGALALIDPETLEYLAVLPGPGVDVRWSADYRHASTGFTGGHGGHCGG